MAPKLVTDGFDQLTHTALSNLGMSPEFITDFDRWEALKDKFDFTSVNKDEMRNLVNSVGKKGSKRAFEEVGHVVDKGMNVLAGVMGATGQWYATAAALVGEEALDWAEDKFENWMGWNEDEPPPYRGEWAILDVGNRRMLGEDTFDDVSPEEQDLAELHGRRLPSGKSGKLTHRKDVILVTAPGDHMSEVFNLATFERKQVNNHAFIEMKKEKQAEMNAGENTAALKVAVMDKHGEASLRNSLKSQVRKDWGSQVNYDGQRYTVSRRDAHEAHVFLENDAGQQIEVPMNDPRLGPLWEKTNARPYPDYNDRAGFMQPAPGLSQGTYCWLDHGKSRRVLVVVQFVKWDQARVAKTTDAELLDVQVTQLEPLETASWGKVFTQFAAAVAEDDRDKMLSWLPYRSFPQNCVESQWPSADPKTNYSQHPTGGFPPKGKPEDAPVMRQVDTPGLAQALDQNKELYDKMSQPFPMNWEVRSITEEPPAPESTKGFDLIPLLLGAALVVFVATR